MRMIRVVTYAALVGMTWLAQSMVARAADDIVFGFAIAETGGFQAYDIPASNMAKIWIQQANARGGVLGKKIRTVFADTKSDRSEGAKAGQQVVSEGAKLVFVSCDYDFGSPAALQAQRAGVISVSVCAEDPKMGVVGVGKYAFSASGAAQVFGAATATWAYKDRNFRKMYLLLDDSFEYPKSACSGYEWMFPKLGGSIVGRDSFKTTDVVFASQITRLSNAIRDKGVDVLGFCADVRVGPTAIKQIREAGIDLPIVSCTAMDGTYWLPAVPNLDNFYVPVVASTGGADPRPAVNALTKEYTDKYGPPPNQYVYPIYAFLQVWEKAVKEANTTDAGPVVAKLEQFKDVPTVLGPRSFTAQLHMQGQMPVLIQETSHGKLKVVGNIPSLEPIPTDILYRKK